jgi:hypothetical protein
MRAARCLNKSQPGARLCSAASHTRPPLAEFSLIRVNARSRRPAMARCERKRIGYIFGLAGNPVLRRRAGPLAEDAALGRLDGEGRRSAATTISAMPPRAGPSSAASSSASRPVSRGADSRFIVTNLPGLPKGKRNAVTLSGGA